MDSFGYACKPQIFSMYRYIKLIILLFLNKIFRNSHISKESGFMDKFTETVLMVSVQYSHRIFNRIHMSCKYEPSILWYFTLHKLIHFPFKWIFIHLVYIGIDQQLYSIFTSNSDNHGFRWDYYLKADWNVSSNSNSSKKGTTLI